MKEELKKVLDFDCPTLVYESIEEVEKDGGAPGTALRIVNDYLVFHGSNADARDLIVDIVKELTEVPQKTKQVKKGDKMVEVVDEKDSLYVARALAENTAVTREDVQEILSTRARGYKDGQGNEVAAIAASAKQRERVAGPVKLPALYREKATAIVGDEAREQRLAKFLKDDLGKTLTLPELDGTDEAKEKRILAIGWAVREHSLWREKNSNLYTA